MFRTPMPRYLSEDWPFRSTWSLQRGVWTQLEDHVRYVSLELPNAPLKPSADELITRFEKARTSGSGTSAAVTQRTLPKLVSGHTYVLQNELSQTLIKLIDSISWPNFAASHAGFVD